MKLCGLPWLPLVVAACSVNTDYTKPDGPSIDAPDGPDPFPAGSWAKHIPGAGYQNVDAVAIGSDGTVYAAGVIAGSIDVGGGPLGGSGNNLFVAKFSKSGAHLSSRLFGNGMLNQSSSVGLAVLPSGDVIVASTYGSSLQIGTDTLNAVGSDDIFVARLSSDLAPVWARSGGTSEFDTFHDLVIDSNDNIALCGTSFRAGSFFGSPSITTTGAWLVSVTGAGAFRWSRTTDAKRGGCTVAAASNGDILFAGGFEITATVGGGTLTSNGGEDWFVGRYAGANGTHVWSTSKGGGNTDTANDIAMSGDSVIVAGEFRDTVSYAGQTQTATGTDGYVVKLDAATGADQASVFFLGDSDLDRADHIAVSDGQVAVVGTFGDTCSFGETKLVNKGNKDVFAVELDGASLGVQSARAIGGDDNGDILFVYSVAISRDSLVVAGGFSGSLSLLGQSYINPEFGDDGYLVRFQR